MSLIAADFAWNKPPVSQLLALNVTAVGMYVSHDASKNANLAVVRNYAGAGIKSFLFAEDAANRATGGYAAGQADAPFYHSTAAQYGKPGWATIIPAMDFDIPDYAPGSNDPKAKLGPVGEYLRAWHDFNQAHHIIADSAYGNFYLIQRATAAGLCKLGVQTIAWSGGQVDLKDIVLFQNGQMFNAGAADVEIIESTALLTHLAWVPGEANPVTPVPIPPPAPAPTPSTKFTWAQWPATKELDYGAKGVPVGVLQTALRNSGIPGARGITVDEDFGLQTLTGVRNFQYQKFGISGTDGKAGQRTRSALVSLNDL